VSEAKRSGKGGRFFWNGMVESFSVVVQADEEQMASQAWSLMPA
jgi:hypothetical protein